MEGLFKKYYDFLNDKTIYSILPLQTRKRLQKSLKELDRQMKLNGIINPEEYQDDFKI